MNHNFFHLIDLKVTLDGAALAFVSFSGAEAGFKILGSLIFIGYTARRWWLLEKNKNKKDEL